MVRGPPSIEGPATSRITAATRELLIPMATARAAVLAAAPPDTPGLPTSLQSVGPPPPSRSPSPAPLFAGSAVTTLTSELPTEARMSTGYAVLHRGQGSPPPTVGSSDAGAPGAVGKEQRIAECGDLVSQLPGRDAKRLGLCFGARRNAGPGWQQRSMFSLRSHGSRIHSLDVERF